MSEKNKKIIIWLSTLLVAAILLFFWAKSIPERLESFFGGEFIEKINLPKFEMPKFEISDEEFENKIKELEEIIKNGQEASTTTE